ncbi:HAD family hydrolase [Streptomyces sp. NBC_01477]|uniref:HAD family hydrolase n=1 Tax=Streptomyces sp. NBC_01477 TaxID=2976015 RepID=UPI002E32FF2E|nr:HAD family hydrolase [Streptomyces sp. NBC_01477]
MSFSAVVFDFFGTLTPSTPAGVWDEHAARSAAPLGIPEQQWRRALDESFPERAMGTLGDLPQSICTLAQRCGVTPDGEALAAATSARLVSQRELFVLRDEALDTLEQLRSDGFRIGVLSDCTIELAETWPTLPLAPLVDAVVLSCQEGRRKPDPELFRKIARELGTPTSECLYVGDGGGDELTGATSQGMTAVMLRASDWATNDAHAREDSWPGPFFSTLSHVVSAACDPSLITS